MAIQVLDYVDLMSILLNPKIEKRTRALIAFQYASAARIGELFKYDHKVKERIKDKETNELITTDKTIEYITPGLLKSKFFMGKDKIYWTMRNFKTRNKNYLVKNPFVLREEKVLWKVIRWWLNQCEEQVFELKEARARQLIRQAISPYSSHILRRSRGTHLVEIFGYNAYEIKAALGHVSLETGIHYISTANREKKMREVLQAMNKEGENDSVSSPE